MAGDIDPKRLVRTVKAGGVDLTFYPVEIEVEKAGFAGAMLSVVSGGAQGGYGKRVRARYNVIATANGRVLSNEELADHSSQVLDAATEVTGQPRPKLEFIVKEESEDG